MGFLSVCDWARKNGPSGHTKFDHIFQVCYIITTDLLKLNYDMKFLSSINNLISNILELTEGKYCTQNLRY